MTHARALRIFNITQADLDNPTYNINSIYRKLALKHHPDKNFGKDVIFTPFLISNAHFIKYKIEIIYTIEDLKWTKNT
jgi:hypothetical protein